MVSESHNRQHQSARKRASCLICKKLEECPLREDILSPEINVSNFAKYGCIKYDGDLIKEAKTIVGFEAENSFTLTIFNELKQPLNIKEAMIKYNSSIDRLAGAIYRLKKKGYDIVRENGCYILKTK